MQTYYRTQYTETQQDANWGDLSQKQRDYFNHLAANDPQRNGQEFFEDTVPPEIQNNPEHVESYLNGNEEQGIPDRDWSHDTSRANGGSDSADNGRFEDASTNRARGSANSTSDEQAAADAATDEDVETLLESAEDVADASAWGMAADISGGIFETTFDVLLPIAGSAVVGKKIADKCKTTTDKVGYGALGAGGTALFLASPLGAPVITLYVGGKLLQRGYRIFKKHTK